MFINKIKAAVQAFNSADNTKSVVASNKALVAQAKASKDAEKAIAKAKEADKLIVDYQGLSEDQIILASSYTQATDAANNGAQKAAELVKASKAAKDKLDKLAELRESATRNFVKAQKAVEEQVELEIATEINLELNDKQGRDKVAALLKRQRGLSRAEIKARLLAQVTAETVVNATPVVEEKSETPVERQLPVPPLPPVRANNAARDEKLVENIKAILKLNDEQAKRFLSSTQTDLMAKAKKLNKLSQFEALKSVWSAGAWKWGAISNEFKALYAEFKAQASKELDEVVTPEATANQIETDSAGTSQPSRGFKTPKSETSESTPIEVDNAGEVDGTVVFN